MATSSLPSPFRSPSAISSGLSGTVVLLKAGPNWPSPLPPSTVIERVRALASIRSGFRSQFMSPINMLLGPPCTATGEPGELANNDCWIASELVLPEGQEMKNEIEDAANNQGLILVAILKGKLNTVSFSLLGK